MTMELASSFLLVYFLGFLKLFPFLWKMKQPFIKNSSLHNNVLIDYYLNFDICDSIIVARP